MNKNEGQIGNVQLLTFLVLLLISWVGIIFFTFSKGTWQEFSGILGFYLVRSILKFIIAIVPMILFSIMIMGFKGKGFKNELFLTLPSLLMLIFLVGIPTLIVIFTAFCADSSGTWKQGFSLDAFREIFTVYYAKITLETIVYTTLTTFFSIVIGLPVAYFIARCRGRLRQLLLLMVFIPFWTNMIVHIAAWKIVLHPDGMLHDVLVFLHLIGEKQFLWNTPFSVLTLFIYVFLPFAIIPLYAAIEKFDFRLMESARDLGATSTQAIFRVFLPGIRHGIASAAVLVFVPVLGCYIIPQLAGGPGCDVLYANKIFQYTSTQSYNIPIASALSLFLLLAMFIPWVTYRFVSNLQAKQDGELTVRKEKA